MGSFVSHNNTTEKSSTRIRSASVDNNDSLYSNDKETNKSCYIRRENYEIETIWKDTW